MWQEMRVGNALYLFYNDKLVYKKWFNADGSTSSLLQDKWGAPRRWLSVQTAGENPKLK